MTGRFGTSENFVFGIQGPIKAGVETDEVCTTCQFSASGPHKFAIHREDHRSVTLICPNCGETKTVFPNEVQRKPNLAEQDRRVRLQRIADEGRVVVEEAAQLADAQPAAKKAATRKKAPTKKKTTAKKAATRKKVKASARRVQKVQA